LVGQYEEDDELRRACAVYRGGACTSTAGGPESDTLRPSGLKQAADSVAVCSKSEREDTVPKTRCPSSTPPPRYEECPSAVSVRQDGGDVPLQRTTLSESRVQTTRLFGILVLKKTLCATRSKSEGGSEATCGVYA
jgi:hypothetical protein